MSEKKVDASIIRGAMHKAVDQLIDTIESCPSEVLTSTADDEEISLLGADHNFRDQPWFQETASDYDQNTLHHQVVARVELNGHWKRINEETKDSIIEAQKAWDAEHAEHATDPKWNAPPRPRLLRIVNPASLNGYHLLDENGGSLQELFRENLY